MRGIARFAVVALALTAAVPAAAQSWRVAGISGSSPDRAAYLIDADSITRNGDTVRFRSQSIFEQIGDRTFDRSVTTREGNCATMSSAIVANIYFANGSQFAADEQRGDMVPHREGTIMYGVLSIVCGKRDYATNVIANPETTIRSYFAQNK